MDQMSVVSRFQTAIAAIAATLAIAVTAILFFWGSEHVPGWSQAFLPGPLSKAHQFLSNKCETCHTPVQGVSASVCIACHASTAADLGKQPTAFHFAATDCRGCHAEHSSRSRPTRMDHDVLLGNGASPVLPSGPSRLREVVGDFRKLLGMPLPETRKADLLDCASCHSNRDPHRGLFGRNCASCHNSTTWRVPNYTHPSASSKDCAQCHQAPPSHYMEHFATVSQSVARQEHAKVNECFLCHRTDSFSDIRGVGWYKHH